MLMKYLEANKMDILEIGKENTKNILETIKKIYTFINIFIYIIDLF